MGSALPAKRTLLRKPDDNYALCVAEHGTIDRTRLRKVFIRLFPERADATRVLHDARIERDHIDLDGSPAKRWTAVLDEVREPGALRALLAVARADYPNDTELAEFESALGAALSLPDAQKHNVASPERVAEAPAPSLRIDLLVLALVFQWIIGRAHMELVGPHDTLQHVWRLVARTVFCVVGLTLALSHPGSERWPRTTHVARHALFVGCAWMVVFTYLELFWFRAHPSSGPFVWLFLKVGLPALYGSLWTAWSSLFVVGGDLVRGWRHRRSARIMDRLRS